MTSIEYAKENDMYHYNISRRIKNYIKELRRIGINSDEYFIETCYTPKTGIKQHEVYEITDKGLEMLKSNVRSTQAPEYCINYNTSNVLPIWVVMNLRTYGNCSINPKYVKKYGEEKILSGLLSCGLDCDINIYDKTFTYFTNIGMTDFKEKFCILTVK